MLGSRTLGSSDFPCCLQQVTQGSGDCAPITAAIPLRSVIQSISSRVGTPHLSTQSSYLKSHRLKIWTDAQCPPQCHQGPGVIIQLNSATCQPLPRRIVKTAIPQARAIHSLCLKVVPHSMPTNSQLMMGFSKPRRQCYQILGQADCLLVFTTIVHMHHPEQMLLMQGGTIPQ